MLSLIGGRYISGRIFWCRAFDHRVIKLIGHRCAGLFHGINQACQDHHVGLIVNKIDCVKHQARCKDAIDDRRSRQHRIAIIGILIHIA